MLKELKGNDIVLTIDEGLQHIVEKNLDAAMAKWHAASATVIMMDPYTGEILALANRPTYNLNDSGNAGMQKLRTGPLPTSTSRVRHSRLWRVRRLLRKGRQHRSRGMTAALEP